MSDRENPGCLGHWWLAAVLIGAALWAAIDLAVWVLTGFHILPFLN